MKRTQRLSIEIQHREVVIAVSGAGVEWQDVVPQEAGSMVPVCPVCGCAWVSVAVHGGTEAIATNNIQRALEQAGMHVHVSPTGELSICRKTLEDLKEKR